MSASPPHAEASQKNSARSEHVQIVYYHVLHGLAAEQQQVLPTSPVRLKSPTRSSPAPTGSTPFTVVIRLSLLSSRAGRQSKIAASSQIKHEAREKRGGGTQPCCQGLPPKYSFTCWRMHCLDANRIHLPSQWPQQQWCKMKLTLMYLMRAARRRNTAGVVPAGAAGCKTTCRRPSTLVFFACSSGWPSKGSAGWAGAAPLGAASVIWIECKQSPPPYL